MEDFFRTAARAPHGAYARGEAGPHGAGPRGRAALAMASLPERDDAARHADGVSLLNEFLQRRGRDLATEVAFAFEEREEAAPRVPVSVQAMDRRPRALRAAYRCFVQLHNGPGARSRWHEHKKLAKKEACGELLRLLEGNERLWPEGAQREEDEATAISVLSLVLLRGAEVAADAGDDERRARLRHWAHLAASPALADELMANMARTAELGDAAPSALLRNIEACLGPEEIAHGDRGAVLHKWLVAEYRLARGDVWRTARAILPALGIETEAEIARVEAAQATRASDSS